MQEFKGTELWAKIYTKYFPVVKIRLILLTTNQIPQG